MHIVKSCTKEKNLYNYSSVAALRKILLSTDPSVMASFEPDWLQMHLKGIQNCASYKFRCYRASGYNEQDNLYMFIAGNDTMPTKRTGRVKHAAKKRGNGIYIALNQYITIKCNGKITNNNISFPNEAAKTGGIDRGEDTNPQDAARSYSQ